MPSVCPDFQETSRGSTMYCLSNSFTDISRAHSERRSPTAHVRPPVVAAWISIAGRRQPAITRPSSASELTSALRQSQSRLIFGELLNLWNASFGQQDDQRHRRHEQQAH